jgi:hypothetical protein
MRTDDKWINPEAALTAFGLDGFEWLRLRWAIMAGPIRVSGQKAQDPQSEPIEIPPEHLTKGTLELPDTLIVPATPGTLAPIIYINVRFSQPDIEKILQERRASQAGETHRRGEYYFNQLRWPLHRALAWIAFRSPEALTLTFNELVLDRWATLRGYGNAAGLVSGNPADQLLEALKADKLQAIDANGNNLRAEVWDERSSDPRTWPKVRLRRDDMRQLWRSGPDLRAFLKKGIEDQGAMLTQAEAWKIARDAGANATRDEVIETLKSLGGSDKPGPKGPRKKHAARSA